jgi:hypothetical protein
MTVLSTLNSTIDGYTVLDRNDYFWSASDISTCLSPTITIENILVDELELSTNDAVCENRDLFNILEEVQNRSIDLTKQSDSTVLDFQKRNKLIYISTGILFMIVLYFNFSGKQILVSR